MFVFIIYFLLYFLAPSSFIIIIYEMNWNYKLGKKKEEKDFFNPRIYIKKTREF